MTSDITADLSGGGNLRAAVFGVNDGLISNASLILGVAGANADAATILLTGVAGLVAGAFSMAAGEYVSVRSQREMYEYQIGLERDELAEYPDEEAHELALIYEARGMGSAEALRMATQIIADPERALDTLAREELGLNPEDLGSPWGAALFSFISFALGSAIPLLPFFFGIGRHALAGGHRADRHRVVRGRRDAIAFYGTWRVDERRAHAGNRRRSRWRNLFARQIAGRKHGVRREERLETGSGGIKRRRRRRLFRLKPLTRRLSASALLPGQSVESPAAFRAAVMIFVKLTFETVQHVVDLGKAGCLERVAGVERAVAAATDQYHRTIDAGGFFDVRDKIGIDVPVRAVVPRDVYRAGWVADEQVLHLAAAVDEYGIGSLVQHFVSLLRFEVFHRVFRCGEVVSISPGLPRPY